MPKVNTEELHHASKGLDSRPALDVATTLLKSQVQAAQSAEASAAQLTAAAHEMARAIRSNGRLYYVAAGSSGLMGAADAMELGGTFGISEDQIRIVMAGGLPTSAHMPGDTEDLTSELTSGLADLSTNDVVIVISASGSTPFTLEAVQIANAVGASVIAVANNKNARLFDESSCCVLLSTPPEILSGSTRLGAGTAQKIALNTMSTLMALELGHIYDGMMVNLRADNIKLRDRAHRIVSEVAGVDEAAATNALSMSCGNVKVASLLAAGAENQEHAQLLLDENKGHLRPALEQIRAKTRLEKKRT